MAADPQRTGARMVPWSFSRLKDYERCPFYAYQVHVLKQRGPQSPAAARGEKLHKEAEDFVKARTIEKKRAIVPAFIKDYSADLAKIVKLKSTPQTELKFGITDTWTPADFFGKNVWGRGVWDLVVLDPEALRVIDYKTGRVYPETTDQLRFYAAAAFSIAPAAPKVFAEAWHADQPYPQGKMVFELWPKEIQLVRRDFEARVSKMSLDKKLQPRPNAYCGRCHLRKSVGGPCPEKY